MKLPLAPRSAPPVHYFRPVLLELENRLAPACAILNTGIATDPNDPGDKGTPVPVLTTPVNHILPIFHGGPVGIPVTPPTGNDGSTDDGSTDDGSGWEDSGDDGSGWDDSGNDGSTDDGTGVDDSGDDGSGWNDSGWDDSADGTVWVDDGDPGAGDGNTDGDIGPICWTGGIFRGPEAVGATGGCWDDTTDGVVPIYYSMRGGFSDETLNDPSGDPAGIVDTVKPIENVVKADTSSNDLTTTGNAAFAAQSAIESGLASTFEHSSDKASDDSGSDVIETVASRGAGKSDDTADAGTSLVTLANALHKTGDKDVGDGIETSFLADDGSWS